MKFEFIRNLFKIKENIGFSEDEISIALDKWGELPKLLIEYYRELGKAEDINALQNFLMSPNKIFEKEGYLIFYIENQYCAEWGIKKSDLKKDNPPVYCRSFDEKFNLESNTLEEFLNAMFLFQGATGGLTYSIDDIYMITEEQANKIKAKFKKLPYELHIWMKVDFYRNNDDEVIMLLENNDYDLNFASSNQEHYTDIKNFMDTLNLTAY